MTTAAHRVRSAATPTEVAISRRRDHSDAPSTVTLVRPPILIPRAAMTAPTCPPVGVAYLAGALRAAGHDVCVIDAVGEAPRHYEPIGDARFLSHGLPLEEIARRVDPGVDVIGVSAMFSHEWPLTRHLIELLRRQAPEALIVAGGEHITAAAEFSLRDCPQLDLAVVGEGEQTLLDIVGAGPAGAHAVPGVVSRPGHRHEQDEGRAPTRGRIRNLDTMAAPAWDLLPIDNYLDHGFGFGVARGRSMPVVATRGCPYRCTFCSSPQMWTTRWEARSPQEVLEEIRSYIEERRADNIDFYDLTAIVRRSWIVEFCELVLASGLEFTWQLPSGTRSEVIDAEVAGLLAASGCRNMSYAPESGSPTVLTRIKKQVDLDRMKSSMRDAVASGINCKANIIMGFPGETHRELRETLRFCVELAVLGLHDLSVTAFAPYPGSELFEELQREGRIGALDDDFFFSLGAYSDLSRAVSWSEHVSDRALGGYRALGMALFYAVSFARRPRRLLQLFRNAVSGRQESRLDMTVHHHLERRRAGRAAAPAA